MNYQEKQEKLRKLRSEGFPGTKALEQFRKEKVGKINIIIKDKNMPEENVKVEGETTPEVAPEKTPEPTPEDAPETPVETPVADATEEKPAE